MTVSEFAKEHIERSKEVFRERLVEVNPALSQEQIETLCVIQAAGADFVLAMVMEGAERERDSKLRLMQQALGDLDRPRIF